MSVLIGLDAELNINGTPMPNVKTVGIRLSKGEADISTRGSGGWKLTAATLKEASLEWDMVWDDTDPDQATIMDSFMNNTPIAFYAKDKSGGKGLDADFIIASVSKDEPLEGAQNAKIVAKPTFVTKNPNWG